MNLRIVAAAHLDELALRSSTGTGVLWSDVGLDPARGELRFPRMFGTPPPGFRRMDLTSRVYFVATESLDLAQQLTADERRDTAIVLGTQTGCLAADERFQRGLEIPDLAEPSLFPYTLPSTCLGEVAIRHALQGPTLCLSVELGNEADGLRAAVDLITSGEAPAAIVLLGDWVPIDSTHPAKTRVVALLLDGRDTDTPELAPLEDLLADPISATVRALDA